MHQYSIAIIINILEEVTNYIYLFVKNISIDLCEGEIYKLQL